MTMKFLRIEGISKHYGRGFLSSKIQAVNDVSFSINKGESLGLVGESGSGKTTVARIIAGLIKADSGRVSFKGNVQMVFQNPKASLNPRMVALEILKEPFYLAKIRTGIENKIDRLLQKVGLSKNLLSKYPHELSGGEQQRLAIARAIALHPDLVILDEPLSSLDVVVQAQIAKTLIELQREFKLTYLFITHNLGWARRLCQEIAVMYQGRIVEKSPSEKIFSQPKHPFTKELLEAVPKVKMVR